MFAAPPRYKVIDLGTLGGSASLAFGINNAADVGGAANVPSEYQHPFLWIRGSMIDLGTLGGPNANAGAPNDRDVVPVMSETAATDPLGENFCGFGTGHVCLGAVWGNHSLTPLPTLGGNNAEAIAINNRGQVVGLAENGVHDSSCSAPQVLDYEAVVWGPNPGEMHSLPPLPGDTVGFALGINDRGQAVGSSGTCANTPLLPLQVGPHAVLWDRGVPRDLGSLNPGNSINTAAAINNRSEVVGAADIAGALHTFLWTGAAGMRDLGTVGTDVASLPGGMGGINNRSQVVGSSCATTNYLSGPCRAYLWEDGTMLDLNGLVVGISPLYLVLAYGINDAGEMAGFGVTNSSEVHAFLAVPVAEDQNFPPSTIVPTRMTGVRARVGPR